MSLNCSFSVVYLLPLSLHSGKFIFIFSVLVNMTQVKHWQNSKDVLDLIFIFKQSDVSVQLKIVSCCKTGMQRSLAGEPNSDSYSQHSLGVLGEGHFSCKSSLFEGVPGRCIDKAVLCDWLVPTGTMKCFIQTVFLSSVEQLKNMCSTCLMIIETKLSDITPDGKMCAF